LTDQAFLRILEKNGRRTRTESDLATHPDPPASGQAVVAILRAADTVRRRMSDALEPHGITGQQYNVLRILRGAHPEPLPTLEIGERMMERNPGVTRLLDRLEQKGLVDRERGERDRRQMRRAITPRGLALLAALDDVIRAANESVFAGMDEASVCELARLLQPLARN
jgi:DNA-binding MarR family transcriptional regulator